jgi:hypothetical protein
MFSVTELYEVHLTVSQIDRLAKSLPIEYRELRVVLVIFDENFCGSDEFRTWDTRGKAVKPKNFDHLATGTLNTKLIFLYTVKNKDIEY